MKILITGVCGFVGSSLARTFCEGGSGFEIHGVDNLCRPGSEINRRRLGKYGVKLRHADVRNASDLEDLPSVDWVIDAAANPSVLAGISGPMNSRQVVEHNLLGTVNLLELCKRHTCGFVMISTSRIYSLSNLSSLNLEVRDNAFVPSLSGALPDGLTIEGVTEEFSTAPPLSLYGATKLASEALALDYACAFDFPVYIDRCGVLAGSGQYGRPDQGIFSFWIHSYCWRQPLRYVGFGGSGFQVRDCLHPTDLAKLVMKQILAGREKTPKPINASGGKSNSISLAQLSAWCAERFGPHPITADRGERKFDVPWLVLNAASAKSLWQWKPEVDLCSILEEIAIHAEQNPEWLALSSET
jgi:CDP-paratose 2-epimerase